MLIQRLVHLWSREFIALRKYRRPLLERLTNTVQDLPRSGPTLIAQAAHTQIQKDSSSTCTVDRILSEVTSEHQMGTLLQPTRIVSSTAWILALICDHHAMELHMALRRASAFSKMTPSHLTQRQRTATQIVLWPTRPRSKPSIPPALSQATRITKQIMGWSLRYCATWTCPMATIVRITCPTVRMDHF